VTGWWALFLGGNGSLGWHLCRSLPGAGFAFDRYRGAEFVTDYLQDHEADLKVGVHHNYVRLRERRLRAWITLKVRKAYKPPDAFVLWKRGKTHKSDLRRDGAVPR
jgi:hypothetical protein